MNDTYSHNTQLSNSWSRGFLQAVLACPACGSTLRSKSKYCRRDDLNAMPDVWCMVRCDSCGSLFLDPRPDAFSLPLAYQDYYTHQPDDPEPIPKHPSMVNRLLNGYLAWRFGINRRPYWRIGGLLFICLPHLRMKLDVYGRHVPRSWCCDSNTRILDVGCGNGSFLARALEMGVTTQGCEPDPKAAATCRKMGLNVIDGDAFSPELDGKQFDMITLNHVIEHVDAPIKLLKRLYSLLRPGGLIWMALPNPGALGLRLYDASWKGFHPPFHLLIPHQRIIAEWLRDNGFDDVRLLCRGAQSPGLWGESRRIAERDGKKSSPMLALCVRACGDLLCTVSSRWGEETVMMARRAG